MVERWHPTSDSIMLIAKHPGGDYVRHSDYAALEAQVTEAIRERDEAERLKIAWFECHLAHQEANQSLGRANTELFKRAMDAERRVLSALEATPPAPSASDEFLRTAKELRENSNGDCNAIQQAIYFEGKAKALEATPPAPKGPWPVYYANTTAPGRFTPPAPKVTEADDEHLLAKALVLITEYGRSDAKLAAAIAQFIQRETHAALTASGYRILGPDEIDVVTVEKCAEHLEGWGDMYGDNAAADIRALCATHQGDK